MRTLRVALSGANGRMGREITRLVGQSSGFYICATIDSKIASGSFNTHTRIEGLKSAKPDVVIDFSSPKGTVEIARWCLNNKKPLVVGTTGFSVKEKALVTGCAKKIPVLMSSNMSPGINALMEALKVFAQNFPNCDVAIEEIHHKHKKDKPSGTALMLEGAVKAGGKGHRIQPIASLRGGEIFGIHKVYFLGSSEWIGFEHYAQNRSVFAEGALMAARWLYGKPAGLYSMGDLFAKRGKK